MHAGYGQRKPVEYTVRRILFGPREGGLSYRKDGIICPTIFQCGINGDRRGGGRQRQRCRAARKGDKQCENEQQWNSKLSCHVMRFLATEGV
jgi:hypothetical protein